VTAPAIEFAERTDPGRDPEKQVNEDACGYRLTRFGHLCVVCDGMGGHAGGREASNLALTTIFEWFEAAPLGARPADVLREAIVRANQRVFALSSASSPGHAPIARPGSTVVAALLHAGGTEIAHVGDSRCYFAHEGQIVQLTKDHSMVQEMVDLGVLTPEQAAVHPDANRITRALGMAPEVEVDVLPQPLPHVAGDTFVLGSDGLSDLVKAPEILQIVLGSPPVQAAGQLVDLANARGGHDNVTVQVLRARESARVQPGAVAATVAQTHLETARAAPTVAIAPAPLAPVVHVPLPPPAPPMTRPPFRRLAPSLVIGMVLATVGVAAAGGVLYLHMTGRGGSKRKDVVFSTPASSAAEAPDAGNMVLAPDAS
jgi:PPM family protein phosphatase